MAGQTALVVSAHAADFVWRAGGAIASHAAKGYAVTIVCLSFGERGESAKLWKQPGISLQAVKDARRIVGPQTLIGVSTHNITQARQAVLDGADYLGVGPVFPSGTKAFSAEELAGLEYVQAAAAEIRLPWFALSGIDAENLSQVTAAGATRIAVSGAISRAADPAAAAADLQRRLR